MRFLRWLLLLPALLPAACHYRFTGPALWVQSSSSAFDLWLFLTAVCVAAPCWAAVALYHWKN